MCLLRSSRRHSASSIATTTVACLLIFVAVTSMIVSAQEASLTRQKHRQNWARNNIIKVGDMYLRLRFGPDTQDSFSCSDVLAEAAGRGVRSCLTSYLQDECDSAERPSRVELGPVTCEGDSVVFLDGGTLSFIGSDSASAPSSEALAECLPRVVGSQQCLDTIRQESGLSSLSEVTVQSILPSTSEPTTFPTSPPSPTPIIATEAPTEESSTSEPSAGPTEAPTPNPSSSAPSDTPLPIPTKVPTATPSAPEVTDTASPTGTTTTTPPPSSSLPPEENENTPAPPPNGTTIEDGDIVGSAIQESPKGGPSSPNNDTFASAANLNVPMVIGITIAAFVLVALLIGIDRERRRRNRTKQREQQETGGASSGGTHSLSAELSPLWLEWFASAAGGGRRRRSREDAAGIAPASSSARRDLMLAGVAEKWEDTGSSAADDESYRGDLRLMAMVEVGQEEQEEVEERGGHECKDRVAVSQATDDEVSPTATGVDKIGDDEEVSLATSQALGGGAAVACPAATCVAADSCTRTGFPSWFPFYRPSSSSDSRSLPLANGDALSRALPDQEEFPAAPEFEPDPSWNPDDNSVGSRGANVEPFQPYLPTNTAEAAAVEEDQSSLVALASQSQVNASTAAAMVDDQSSLVALASQNPSASVRATSAAEDQVSLIALASYNSSSYDKALPGVLSYRMMPIELTSDEELIDIPLQDATFRAADNTVDL